MRIVKPHTVPFGEGPGILAQIIARKYLIENLPEQLVILSAFKLK
jgi:hypothetical protein